MLTSPKSGDTVESPLTFGPALRELRRLHMLSQQELARRAGITNVTLSTWETGKVQPRLPELQTVLQALNVTAAQRRTLLQLWDVARASRHLHRVEGAAVPPIGSDLLRAMRLRHGWTQADAAQSAGVHQAQIARWERGESWPTTEKLHALCWALSASAEEVAALTATFSGQSIYQENVSPYLPPATIAEVAEAKEIAAVDEERWRLHLHWLMHEGTPPDALLDLTLLSVESSLGTLTERHDFAALLLPVAYAIHARHHLNYDRTQQASIWGTRGLRQVQRWSADSFSRDGRGDSLWFGNVIAVASHAARNDSHAGMRRAVRVLKQWLPALTQPDDSHRGWGMSDLAHLLAKLGNADEAIFWSAEASSPAHTLGEMDALYRKRDHAETLVQAGRFGDAWIAIEQCRTMPGYSQGDYYARHYYARHHLLEAECLIGLNEWQSAGERLRAAEQQVRDYHLTHLQEAADRLAILLQEKAPG